MGILFEILGGVFGNIIIRFCFMLSDMLIIIDCDDETILDITLEQLNQNYEYVDKRILVVSSNIYEFDLNKNFKCICLPTYIVRFMHVGISISRTFAGKLAFDKYKKKVRIISNYDRSGCNLKNYILENPTSAKHLISDRLLFMYDNFSSGAK